MHMGEDESINVKCDIRMLSVMYDVQDQFSWEQYNLIHRPCSIPDFGLLCDLLWADPHPDVREKSRVGGKTMGERVSLSEPNIKFFSVFRCVALSTLPVESPSSLERMR